MVLVSYDLLGERRNIVFFELLTLIFLSQMSTGSDMLSLGLPPLHVAPFFLYKVRTIRDLARIIWFDCFIFISSYFEHKQLLIYFNRKQVVHILMNRMILIVGKRFLRYPIGCIYPLLLMNKHNSPK
jgi:hypothetical protein